MYIQILRLGVIAAAFTFAVPALGQGFGIVNSGYGLSGPQNCGRAITPYQAEGLWADYCTENCAYTGGNSGPRLGKCSKCGLSKGNCSCNSGCNSGRFGYPAGGGGCGGGGCGGKLGGCKLGSRHGGGCCKLKGLHGGGGCSDCGGGHADFGGGYGGGCSDCGGGPAGYVGGYGGGCSDCGGGSAGYAGGLHGGGGCGCGKLKGGLHGGGGCGCGKLKGGHGGGGCCKLFGGCKKFGHSAQQCGTSGAYFQEAVGYEYGTSGIQSCVSCNSCGSFNGLDPQMAAPVMAAPYAQPQSVLGNAGGSIVPAPVQNGPIMAEPVVGAIDLIN